MSALTRTVATVGLALTLTVGAVAAPGSPVGARSVTIDRTTVAEFGDATVVTGRSMLLRTEHGVLGVVNTGHLVPGDAYTVWAVVFNRPDGCIDGCDGSDVTNPAAEAVSALGTGKVIRRARGTFVVRLDTGPELTNPMGAEIHFVVRTHGPAIPELVAEQTSTLNGGCPPNACANVLMAKHD